MSVYIMAGHHPHGPPPHIRGHMPNPEHPGSPSSSEDERGDDNGHRSSGPHPHHHGGWGHPGFGAGGPHGPRFHHPFEHFGHHRGRGSMFGPRGGFHHGFRGHHRGGRGMHRPPFWPAGPRSFDFLRRFAAEMGNGFDDLFATDRDATSDVNDSQIDFVPHADVFDTITEYVVHVSLPGAQKPDVSIDYDAQESTLHLAGVIHRPEFNEELHAAMIVDERRSEVGVFERSIKLSTRDRQSVDVDQENISAKLVDGVLIVRLPKTQRDNKKVVVNEDDDEAPLEGKEEERGPTQNEMQASVIEIQDELGSMHVDSETEAGDEKVYTPSYVSEDEEEGDAGEFVKVDVK